jgi:hypothetical protein
VKKRVNVAASLSNVKLQEMKAALQVLLKIISSIQFLSQQGLAICGHSNETSKYNAITSVGRTCS